MMFLLRFYPYIAGMAVLLSLTVWVYHRGYSQCQANQALAAIKEEKEHAKIEKTVTLLPDDALRKRYCEWMRDDRKKCLQANLPIGE